MSDQSSSQSQERGWRRLFRGRFLIISILFHVVLILGATYLVVQTFAPRKKSFQAPPAAPQNHAVEHQVQMAKKQKTMSAPAPSKRVTTTGLSKVVLPEMPDMPNAEPVKVAAVTNPGLGMGTGAATGGSGSGGGIPFFGLNRGKGLKGTFYDLKQLANGKPSGVDTFQYSKIVGDFENTGWRQSFFNKYFKAPNELYATQIFTPQIPADKAPAAFGVNVPAGRWVVRYEGRVSPPETGNYYFVGFGDDVLAVRFNGRVVLSSNWDDKQFGIIQSDWKAKERYQYNWPRSKWWTNGMAKGSTFQAKAGNAYPIEILIGEKPGELASYNLMIGKEGVNYEKFSTGAPILPIFRIADTPPPKLEPGQTLPPFQPNGPIWKDMSQQ